MAKKLIISIAAVVVIAAELTLAPLLLPTDNSSNIITSTFSPVVPCACIELDEMLHWDIEREYVESYFTPNYGADRVAQVLYNPENGLFAVVMSKIDGTGNKLFIVEYKNYEILDIIEVTDVVAKPDTRVAIIRTRGISGNLLQIHTLYEDEERVKVVMFDKVSEVVGEFEIVGHRRNGEIELRPVAE